MKADFIGSIVIVNNSIHFAASGEVVTLFNSFTEMIRRRIEISSFFFTQHQAVLKNKMFE
jgi:hypothetical protein